MHLFSLELVNRLMYLFGEMSGLVNLLFHQGHEISFRIQDQCQLFSRFLHPFLSLVDSNCISGLWGDPESYLWMFDSDLSLIKELFSLV